MVRPRGFAPGPPSTSPPSLNDEAHSPSDPPSVPPSPNATRLSGKSSELTCANFSVLWPCCMLVAAPLPCPARIAPRLTGDTGPLRSDFAGLLFGAGDFCAGTMGGGSAIVEADRLTADQPLLPSKPVLAVVIAGPCAPRLAAVVAPLHRRGEVLL